MEITILAVGKLRSYYRESCDDYLTRLRRYVKVEEIEVREANASSAPLCRRQEAERLRARAPEGAPVVVLTRTGKAWSSAELAEALERWQRDARPVAFMIGGSTGLDDVLMEQAYQRWSLGPLTLPHELARVVVAEQLYRAFTILRGEPYHKGR